MKLLGIWYQYLNTLRSSLFQTSVVRIREAQRSEQNSNDGEHVRDEQENDNPSGVLDDTHQGKLQRKTRYQHLMNNNS